MHHNAGRATNQTAQYIEELKQLSGVLVRYVASLPKEDGDHWRDAYDVTFSKAYSVRIRVLLTELNVRFDYDDPDSSYREDVEAYTTALRRRIQELEPVFETLLAGAQHSPAPEAELAVQELQHNLVETIARGAFIAAGRWFDQNDPEAERYYPGFKLGEMADGELLTPAELRTQLMNESESKAALLELEALIHDALQYRAMKSEG